MKILIIKNITREGPGILETLLQEKRVEFDITDLDEGEAFPNPINYQALAVLGGPDSANDKTPKMQNELNQIRKVLNDRIPYLGICLGMQALVKASEGTVLPNNTREIGWRDPEGNFFEIELTKEGEDDLLFDGLSSPLKIFHLHGETVRPAKGTNLLASGKFCHVQAVKIGDCAYGLQGHFELTESMFETWTTQDPDLQKLDRVVLARDYQEIRKEYENTGRSILSNFLKKAGLVDK